MNDYKKLADLILNSTNKHILGYINADCLKCSKVEKEMVKVGCLIRV